ncbi:unnamed protein product [Cuscuta campestris]|uniref:Uncharacterized protein n=1 Tax=Cuscuta campestris TaxID=132261 RepID=A0A484MN57_9ASTE|nr:unnamed protein product [Cuscuta campestris]
MDKNKNRTDLLAAGRKKLQQYRQKNKGSKSSGKPNRSGSEASTDPANVLPDTQHIPGPQRPLDCISHDVSLSELHTIEDPVGSTTILPPVEESEKSETNESSTGINELEMQTDPSVHAGDPCVVEVYQTLVDDVRYANTEPAPLESEAKPTYSVRNDPDDLLSYPDSGNNTKALAHGVDVERLTDIDQEPYNPDPEQVGAKSDVEVELECKHSVNEFGGHVSDRATPDVGENGLTMVQNETTYPTEINDFNLISIESKDAEESDRHSIPLDSSHEAVSAVSSQVVCGQNEGVSTGLPSGEIIQIHCVSTDYDGGHMDRVNPHASVNKEKLVGFSSSQNACLINLSQLADVVRSLDEDEFKFLFMSRDSAVSGCTSSLFDAYESVKEKLYLANLVKDFKSLQLVEESELQISDVNALMNELEDKNEMLANELEQVRSKFQVVIAEKEELHKLLQLSKDEVVDLSARIDELQIRLSMPHEDLFHLSEELASCRNLVSSLEVENEKLSSNLDFLSKENMKLQDEKEDFVIENEKLGMELAQCRNSFISMQLEIQDSNENLTLLNEERRKLEMEKQYFVCENDKLIAEVADCQKTIKALQAEKTSSNELLALVTEESKKLLEEKQSLLNDNVNLVAELRESKVSLEALQMEVFEKSTRLTSLIEETVKLENEKQHILINDEELLRELTESKTLVAYMQAHCSAAVDDLKSASLQLGQWTEENLHMSSSLQLQKSNIKDFETQNKSLSQSNGSQFSGDQYAVQAENVFLHFEFIQRYLDGAERELEKLDKTVEVIHSHSASLRNSCGEVVTPRISKLIQAFESKVHADDCVSEDQHQSGNQVVEDLSVLTKQQIQNLRALLKDVLLESQNAFKLFEGEMKNKLHTNTVFAELNARYESVIEHTDHLEHTNIVLMVLNETFGQYANNAISKEGDFMALYDSLKKDQVTLKAENSHLREELSNFQTKTSELQYQVEALKKEVADKDSILEEEWNSLVAEVVEILSKLELSTVPSSSSLLTVRETGLDRPSLISHISFSVNNAIKMIEALQSQTEAARSSQEAAVSSFIEMHKRFDVLQTENEMINGQINRVYKNLIEIVNERPDQVGEAEINIKNERPIDPLLPGVFDAVLEQLQKLNSERLRLEATSSELISEMDKQKDLTLALYLFLAVSLYSLHSFELGSFGKSSLHRRKVKLLADRDAYKEKQMINLQKEMDQLSLLYTQFENENFILKESLKKLKEDAVALNSQLNNKVFETEQSDQRVASLREKLSIAVARGKSLIVQRDGLKQSLAETSSELEKFSQELHLKDSRILELEIKLKTYSEAAERMEALESELSYIRNSATALRESFLLKDSVLQRIEEIFEDLELPEHFHSQGILEKIDWLAKSVSGNSILSTEWDHKRIVGGSYPEAGTGVGDGWKEDTQSSLSSSEDLRVKYEDLQNKFYRLAEQNEMLEQSLMERNNLVHHWEAVLDTIEMPSQLRSVEPNDKIGWVAFALSEAQNYCNSLQQKIDNFEVLLEGSNRRLFDLEASFESAVNEKDVLLKKLETVTCDNETLSDMAAQFETENNNMQHTISSLQEKLAEMLGREEHMHHILGEIKRLQALVRDALHDNVIDDHLPSVDGIKYLEQLLRMLIDKCTPISFSKAANEDAAVERVLQVDRTESEQRESESRYAEDRDAGTPNIKMGDAFGHIVCLKEERASFLEQHQSLVSEVEAFNTKKKELLELLSQEELKNQSLVSKVDALTTHNKELHELLSQEELKNQSLVSEVEALNMNIKELQELLRQEGPKNQLLISEVDDLNMKNKELLEVLSQQELKNKSLASEIDALTTNTKGVYELLSQEELKNQSLVSEIESLNMNMKELQELLAQEEPKNQLFISEVEDLNVRKKELQELLSQEELKNQSLLSKVEALNMKINELQELLSHQEARNQSLASELEALNMSKNDLQEHLSREELKSASLREKLNVAVRKGKSLVQQRDSLKQSVEELNIDVENLKSKLKLQGNVISDCEERIKDQSALQEKLNSIEADNVLLRNRLGEAEYSLQEREHMLDIILNVFNEINRDFLSTISSPVEKAKHVSNLCLDLQSAVAASEQEAIKSKRAAELLLAELNEVQERNDGLQEELSYALSEVSRLSKEIDFADTAKNEAIANLDRLSATHQQLSAEFLVQKTSVREIKDALYFVRNSFQDVLLKDLEILRKLAANLKAGLGSKYALTAIPLMGSAAPHGTFSISSENKAFVEELRSISEMLDEHSQLVHDEARHITEFFGSIHEEITLQKQSSESLKKDMEGLKTIVKEKDSELIQMRRCSSLLYEACTSATFKIENRREQLLENNIASYAPGNTLVSWKPVGGGLTENTDLSSEDNIRSVSERLRIAVEDIMNVQVELVEFNQKDIKAAMSNLQKELQEKDIQREKICRELVSQIKDAEAIASNYLQELQLTKVRVNDLQRDVKLMEEEKTKLEDKTKELQYQGSALADAQCRIMLLEDMVASKEQENEALMQALDEEEGQMEDMSAKIGELEGVLVQKIKDVEILEVSRGKALKKLSVTLSKFDELHHLSENLLSEIESLQSQVHERDEEISFLRQEVTRCTNDALALSQTSNKQNCDEVYDLVTWLDKTISGLQGNDSILDKEKVHHFHEYQESLQKQLMSIVSEVEGLRAATQSKDLLLQMEKAKVDELLQNKDILEKSLHEKDSQLAILRDVGEPGHVPSTSSEIVEIEALNNKWVTPGSLVTSQVRSLRKTNNDHIAIAVDENPVGVELEDEDDDKAHGFKSLTTSRMVPRFTRPLTNMVDGLWVSCDRALMRQPALRLGLIFYWAIVHALLATFAV